MSDDGSTRRRVADKIRKYHFQLRHVLVLFVILAIAQLLISFVQNRSLQGLLLQVQKSYRKDSAERLANLTAISLELLLERTPRIEGRPPEQKREIVEAFDILLSQQLLAKGVEEVCLLVSSGNKLFSIDDGRTFYDFFLGSAPEIPGETDQHVEAVALYARLQQQMMQTEQIQSVVQQRSTFHVLVPFAPKGEYAGAVYMKSSPDLTLITREIVSSYNKFSMGFSILLLVGSLIMFFISSRTVQERDETQELLFKERERQLKERIHLQKEALFAKRIYHTHHKAEKVMGFIKEDLDQISENNLDEIKNRVTKYANFIARVIYDMKWYEPPLQAIRNPIFSTDLNQVIRFVVENICLRSARRSEMYDFVFDLDPTLPTVPVNEFVVWEILEPIFQNSIDHNDGLKITINISSKYNHNNQESTIIISDNGSGIPSELMVVEAGTQRLFLENVSTKNSTQSGGYGCYIAHQIATERCGWLLHAENLSEGGCRFVLTIKNTVGVAQHA